MKTTTYDVIGSSTLKRMRYKRLNDGRWVLRNEEQQQQQGSPQENPLALVQQQEQAPPQPQAQHADMSQQQQVQVKQLDAAQIDEQGVGLNQGPLIREDVQLDGEGNDGQQADHGGNDSEKEPSPPFHYDETIDMPPKFHLLLLNEPHQLLQHLMDQFQQSAPHLHHNSSFLHLLSKLNICQELAENNQRRVAGLPPLPPKKKPPPGKEPYVFKDPPYFNRTKPFRSRQAKKSKGQSSKEKSAHVDISDDEDEDEDEDEDDFHFPAGEQDPYEDKPEE
ncbi:hypothetical protein ACLOJK_011318 [Asimina triloba]